MMNSILSLLPTHTLQNRIISQSLLQQMHEESSPLPTNHLQIQPQPHNPALQLECISNASSIVIADQDPHQALEDRVLKWFERKGVKACSPQEIFEEEEDKSKRSISLKSQAHINEQPTLSKRVKILSSLHINLDFKHLDSPKLTGSC